MPSSFHPQSSSQCPTSVRTLKRWIHLLPRNNPTEQILNQLCDILNHCTTTSKVIQHITINLAVVRLSFEELIRLDWSYVDDIFENPPPTLRELTLGIRYKRKTFEGKPVLLGDLQTALRSAMERRMPHLQRWLLRNLISLSSPSLRSTSMPVTRTIQPVGPPSTALLVSLQFDGVRDTDAVEGGPASPTFSSDHLCPSFLEF